MRPPTQLPFKKIAWLLAILIVLIVGLNLLYSYLTTGKIAVTSEKTDGVTIRAIDTAYTKTVKGSINARVKPGDYSVTVENTSGSSSKIVHVVARQTSPVSLHIITASQAEPVTSRAPGGLVVDQNAMTFVDINNNNLYRVTADGVEHLVDADHSLTTISWADSSYGIGEDGDAQLYIIEGDSVTPLSLPFSHNNNVSFFITAKRTLYVSNGHYLYVQSAGGSLKRFYSADAGHIITIKAASDDYAVISDAAANSRKNHIALITTSGTVNNFKEEGYEIAVSPSGKNIAVTSDDETVITDNQLQEVAGVPAGNVNSPVWLNDNTLLYGVTSGLWSYDLQNSSSQKIGDVSRTGYVSSITPDKTGKYIYLLVQNNSNSGKSFLLQRINLEGKQPPGIYVRLGVYLPNTVDECSLGYENFVTMTIEVYGPAESQDDCLGKARDYLKLYNANDPSLHMAFVPDV